MNNRYQWDETAISRRRLSLVAWAWARFCPAKTKMAFSLDPIKYITRLKLLVNSSIGAAAGPIVNGLSIAIMEMSWPWVLAIVPAAAWLAGTAFVFIGAANPSRKDVENTMDAAFPGNTGQSDEVSKMATCMDRLWAVEIMSQVAGSRNRARLEQGLMRQTVDQAHHTQASESLRRL